MDTSPDRLLALWHDNATPWTEAVRGRVIESRRLATDQAVIDAVMATAPQRALDVGCGEGWLTRALSQRGVLTLGLDGVPALIEQARQAGGGSFEVAAFADLAAMADSARLTGFDTWVCNFSLFHPEHGEALVAAAARALPAGGALVVQTLHGSATIDGAQSGDAWQPGGWGACGSSFGEPIPWYYRSPASWNALLARHSFDPVTWQETHHPDSGMALSLLLTARRLPGRFHTASAPTSTPT